MPCEHVIIVIVRATLDQRWWGVGSAHAVDVHTVVMWQCAPTSSVESNKRFLTPSDIKVHRARAIGSPRGRRTGARGAGECKTARRAQTDGWGAVAIERSNLEGLVTLALEIKSPIHESID